MLTWSLGWTGVLEPSSPPRSSIARLEITYTNHFNIPYPIISTISYFTSLTFMLLIKKKKKSKYTEGKQMDKFTTYLV